MTDDSLGILFHTLLWLFCWTVEKGCVDDWDDEWLKEVKVGFVWEVRGSDWGETGEKTKGRKIWDLKVWRFWSGLGWFWAALSWVKGLKAIGTKVGSCDWEAEAGNGFAVGVNVALEGHVCGFGSWVGGCGWVVGQLDLESEGKVSIGIDWFLLRSTNDAEEGLSRICSGSNFKGGRSKMNGFPGLLGEGCGTWPMDRCRNRDQTTT